MSVHYRMKKFCVSSSESSDLGANLKFNTLNLNSLRVSDINLLDGLNDLADLQVLSLFSNNLSEIKGLENLSNLLELRQVNTHRGE